jgi:hypothetical protein
MCGDDIYKFIFIICLRCKITNLYTNSVANKFVESVYCLSMLGLSVMSEDSIIYTSSMEFACLFTFGFVNTNATKWPKAAIVLELVISSTRHSIL